MAQPECKKFSAIYADGKALCETMWGDAFTYETNYSRGYTMWFYNKQNPNDEVASLLGFDKPAECYLAEGDVTAHKTFPGPEPATARECHPWQTDACCSNSTWDRCGPLSQACERYFIAEACLYECDPNIGIYARYMQNTSENAAWRNSSDFNYWEIWKMPIRGDFCDAWWRACADDLFCSTDGGNFFECAKVYKTADEYTPTFVHKLEAGAIAGITCAVAFFLCIIFMFIRERQGVPVFQKLETNDPSEKSTKLNKTSSQDEIEATAPGPASAN
eukprot:g28742.t1